MAIIRIVLGVAIGVTTDWAVYERAKMFLTAFGVIDAARYRDLPAWRLALVAIASVTMAASQPSLALHGVWFWGGVALFVSCGIYAFAMALKR